MDKFGADALRLFLMNSAVTRGEDLAYSDEGVKDVLKSVIIPLWNSYGFFVTYAEHRQIPRAHGRGGDRLRRRDGRRAQSPRPLDPLALRGPRPRR